jgi:hypothetical protein
MNWAISLAEMAKWAPSERPFVLIPRTRRGHLGQRQVDRRSFRAVTEGEQAVQLEVPGDTISQTFDTVAGQAYLLTFDLSAFGVGYGFVSTLGVSIGGVSATFSGSYLQYVTESLRFIAHAATSTLTFENVGPYFTYPHLDRVSVVALPEPATWWLVVVGLALMTMIRRRAASKRANGRRSISTISLTRV